MDLQIEKGNQGLKTLLLATAEEYLRQGLQIVCVHSAYCDNAIRRGKAPTHYNWQKDPLSWDRLRQEIERVWAREGGCNIGLRTGKVSGLVCIDIDTKVDGQGGGLGWYHEHKELLGSCVVENSHNGGMHLYFTYPQGVDFLPTYSSGARLFKGVDILADGAAQVVTWPSIHASQECMYRFERNLNLIDALHEAAPLPNWIVEEMLKKHQRRLEASGVEQTGPRQGADALDIKAASLALRDYPAAREGDGGDLNTLKAALLCRDFGLSESQVYDLLLSEYNGRCIPPWEPKELREKIKNAFRYGRMSHGNRSIATAFTTEARMPEELPQRPGDERYSKKNAIHSAKVFLNRHRDRVNCYDGQFVYYDSAEHRWVVISDAYMETIIYRDVEAVEGDGETFRSFKASHLSDIRKIIKMELNHMGGIPDVHWVSGERGRDYISLKNGILDISTGELLRHTSDWFCFQAVDLLYDEDARCEEFLSFLMDIWDGDADLIESLRLWMGYCILSQSNLQKFAVFKGASRAGKSTLVGVIEAMLGRMNCASTSLSLIGSDFGLESLMGKKLCVFQDADRASMDRMGVATERIKSLASNDPVGINRKGQSVVNQRLNIKVAFVCNRMPPFLNDESALTNRMVVFPFWKSFQGKEDFGLSERLEAEAQGILNWALVGARRLLRGERLKSSIKGEEALQGIAEQLDSVQGFVAEALTDTGLEHNKLTIKSLWDAYREWCKESGRMPKNKQKFAMEVSSHYKLVDRRWRTKDSRGIWGYTLAVDTFQAMEDTDDVPF